MDEPTRIRAGGVLQLHNLSLLGVMSAPDRPGIAFAVFQALGDAHINAHFVVQSIDLNNDAHVQFCVSWGDQARTVELLRPIAAELGAQKVIVQSPVAIISVFGPDFRERPGIAGLAFWACAQAGVNILAVSTSISTISCVVAEDGYERALESLNRVFALP